MYVWRCVTDVRRPVVACMARLYVAFMMTFRHHFCPEMPSGGMPEAVYSIAVDGLRCSRLRPFAGPKTVFCASSRHELLLMSCLMVRKIMIVSVLSLHTFPCDISALVLIFYEY